MKKIIPALALLLISAVVMSTASFAWFSMNTSVTASGMSVKAQSTGGLAIASYTGNVGKTATAPAATAFSTSADASASGNWLNGSGDLTPTSTATAQTWFTASAGNVNDYAPAEPAPGATKYTQVTEGDTNKYYRQAMFQVKSLDESTTSGTKASLYVTGITVTGGSDSANLNKALRVAVVDKANKAHFFAPVYTETAPTGSFRYVSSTNATGTYGATSAPTLSFINCTNAQPVQILNGTLDTEPQDISIYVYYEGEDDNCFSLNAVNIDTLSVSVTFSTTGGTATAGD